MRPDVMAGSDPQFLIERKPLENKAFDAPRCVLMLPDAEEWARSGRTRDQLEDLLTSPRSNSPKPHPRKTLLISPTPAVPPLGHQLATDTCQTDPDLAAVIDAWDRLPEAVRAGIVAMVQATAK